MPERFISRFILIKNCSNSSRSSTGGERFEYVRCIAGYFDIHSETSAPHLSGADAFGPSHHGDQQASTGVEERRYFLKSRNPSTVSEEITTCVSHSIGTHTPGLVGNETVSSVSSRFMVNMRGRLALVQELISNPTRPKPLPAASLQCPATVSVLGALCSQEVIKALTHIHTPISQGECESSRWFCFLYKKMSPASFTYLVPTSPHV